MFHALRPCAGVVIAISFQEVDRPPDAQARAQADYECLQNGNC